MKGTIVSGGDTSALYRVKLVHDTTYHDAEVAKANSELAKAVSDIAKYSGVDDKQLAIAQVRKKAAENRLEFLSKTKVLDTIVDAWSATWTLGLSGNVALCEQRLADGTKRYTIYPNTASRNYVYNPALDGRQVESVTQPPYAWFINAAREPWLLRWKPKFRAGTVVAVDTANNTIDVDYGVVQATSIDYLTINDELQSKAIPTDYMGSGAENINVDDEMLIQFAGEDPKNAVCYGFSVNPIPVVYADAALSAVDYVRGIQYYAQRVAGTLYDFQISIINMKTASVIGTYLINDLPYRDPSQHALFPFNAQPISYIGVTQSGFFIMTNISMTELTWSNDPAYDAQGHLIDYFINVSYVKNVRLKKSYSVTISNEEASVTLLSSNENNDMSYENTANNIGAVRVVRESHYSYKYSNDQVAAAGVRVVVGNFLEFHPFPIPYHYIAVSPVWSAGQVYFDQIGAKQFGVIPGLLRAMYFETETGLVPIL